MNCTKFKTGSFAIFILAVCFTACNQSTSSSSKDTDTTSTVADTSVNTNMPAASTTTAKKKLKASIEKTAAATHSKYTKDKAGVYDFSEVMPAFRNGSSDIEDYINDRIEYPQPAIDDSKEGKVVVDFVVDENGKITNAHTAGAKLGDGLDEEAVRVVSGMPAWTPGTIKGKPVKVSMSLPIVFKIEQ